MWTICNGVFDPIRLGSMEPTRVFVYYDGPRVFEFISTDTQSWLAYFVGETDRTELFLAFPLTGDLKTELLSSSRPLRDLILEGNPLILAELGPEGVERTEQVCASRVPTELLPTPNQVLPVEARKPQITFKLDSPMVIGLELVRKATESFERILKVAVEAVSQAQTCLVPLSAKPGSFILELEFDNKENISVESLSAAWDKVAATPEAVSLEDWVELIAILTAADAEVEVSMAINGVGRGILRVERSSLKQLGEKFGKMLLDDQVRPKLTSADIPQADSLQKVLDLVDKLAEKLTVTPQEFELNSPRQLLYYKSAGRILGLLDTERPTRLGLLQARLPNDQKIRLASILFESSRCGERWLKWADASNLLELDEQTAAKFLQEETTGLSEDTVKRRSSTLRHWAKEMKKHHYALP